MPKHEIERLLEVEKFLTLDISRRDELNEIVRYAAELCGTPDAGITLLDTDKQHVLFSTGTAAKQIKRTESLCHDVIAQDNTFMVCDARSDERFAHHTSDHEKNKIGLYAAVPLRTQDGFKLGALYVLDVKSGILSEMQQKMLAVLGRQVMHLLDCDISHALLKAQYLEAKKTEIKLRSFFESSVSCHLLVGKNLEVLAFNKTLAEIMRIDHDVEIHIGNPVTEYIDVLFMPEFLINYTKALSGKHIKSESEMIKGDQRIWWNYDYVPAFDPEGEIIGVSYNAININDLKFKEKQSDAKDASLKAIAFIQTHEIRRPVSSIMGLMSIFKADDYTASQEDLMMMERAVNELDDKIRQIVNHTESHVVSGSGSLT